MHKTSNFLINKTNIFETTFKEEVINDLEEGEVLLKIDTFAFTANNITYAIVGDTIGYWKFFPAPEPYGIIPAWGFASVVASNSEIAVLGQRFYGYYPMGTYLKVRPTKQNSLGFVDGTAHRQQLPPIYNFYTNTAADPMYNKESEGFQPILAPLFITSFLVYHFLKDEAFFKAEQVILTSASSKTALALAFMLKQQQAKDGKKIVALTSQKNVDFVTQTSYYDHAVSYDQLDAELEKMPSVVIDFAGNTALLTQLYRVLGTQLVFSSLIGWADWKSKKEFKTIPRSKFFFAPDHIQKRYKDWGIEKTNLALGKALGAYTREVSKWIQLHYIKDSSELSAFYQDMLNGKLDPAKGYLVQL